MFITVAIAFHGIVGSLRSSTGYMEPYFYKRTYHPPTAEQKGCWATPPLKNTADFRSCSSPCSPIMATTTCRGTIYCAISTDGYIADKDGGVDWLNNCQPETIEGEDCGLGFEDFMNAVDAIIMGRKTFEQVLTFCPPVGSHPWPYGNTPMVILTSNTELKVPDFLSEHVSVSSGLPDEILSNLSKKHNNVSSVYIDGGATIGGFLDAGVIDRAFITRVPVTLGEGIPLFTEKQFKQLKEVDVKKYGEGWSITEYTMNV